MKCINKAMLKGKSDASLARHNTNFAFPKHFYHYLECSFYNWLKSLFTYFGKKSKKTETVGKVEK